MNEQPLKTSRADVLSTRKKLGKTLWGVASTPPPPLPCTSEGKIMNRRHTSLLTGRGRGEGGMIPPLQFFPYLLKPGIWVPASAQGFLFRDMISRVREC